MHLRSALVAVLMAGLLASCGDSGGSTSASTSSTSAAPVALTTTEYQAELSAMDKVVAPAVAAVQAAGSIADLDNARLALAEVLEAEGKRVEALNPPANVVTFNTTLSSALFGAGRQVRTADTKLAPNPDKCGNPADQVGYAKETVNSGIRSLAFPLRSLTDAGFTISAIAPPPSVAPPPGNRRAANGKIIQRSGPKGRGRLKVGNSDSRDVAISVVTGGNPSKPQVMMYVQAGQNATITGISGTYEVYFKMGADWDDGRYAFTRDCDFEKFDQPFDQKHDWEISISQTITGDDRSRAVPGY